LRFHELGYRAGEQVGVPEVFGDYDYKAMLESPNVDVVHITSPNKVHVEQRWPRSKPGST
jgi:predicted dehydrogenase